MTAVLPQQLALLQPQVLLALEPQQKCMWRQRRGMWRQRRLSPELPLEVEVENLAQLEDAHRAGAGRALLDNFSLADLREAVALYGGRIVLEASGGIDLGTIRDVAETGVDCISTGAITKHLSAVDFSMRYC